MYRCAVALFATSSWSGSAAIFSSALASPSVWRVISAPDASGALLTRHPEGLASALEKIAADPDPLEVANKATAHLYINNPLREHKSWLNNMFTTHPPIEDRVKLLRAM